MNKIIKIIGLSIVLEAVVTVLINSLSKDYLSTAGRGWLICAGWAATYLCTLIFAKRAQFFSANSFFKRTGKAILITTPVILHGTLLGALLLLLIKLPYLKNFSWGLLYENMGFSHLLEFSSAMQGLYVIKFSVGLLICLLFSISRSSFVLESDEQELKKYGQSTEGIICRKWQYRHLCFVMAQYVVDGRTYQTDSTPIPAQLWSENDKVTICYSSRYPKISLIEGAAEFRYRAYREKVAR